MALNRKIHSDRFSFEVCPACVQSRAVSVKRAPVWSARPDNNECAISDRSRALISKFGLSSNRLLDIGAMHPSNVQLLFGACQRCAFIFMCETAREQKMDLSSASRTNNRSSSTSGNDQTRTTGSFLLNKNICRRQDDVAIPTLRRSSRWMWMLLTSNLITAVFCFSSRLAWNVDITFHEDYQRHLAVEQSMLLLENHEPERHDQEPVKQPAVANTAAASPSRQHHYLEELMYKYGSDKSKDDHGYTDFYQMIFDPIRLQVRNVTEVGTSAGQSIQAWYHYFSNAQIFAYDWETMESMAKVAHELNDRVQYREANLLGLHFDLQTDAGLYDETMDVIVEDAMHAPKQQQDFLQKLWRLIKPGGYYIIEDIAYPNDESRRWHEHPEQLPPAVQDILQENDAIFIDASTGHRAWVEWQKRAGANAKDHLMHNSYLLVIRKRVVPLREVSMNLRRVAMRSAKVVLDGERQGEEAEAVDNALN